MRSGCAVIGSGPSLSAVDVGRLRGLDAIAFNRSYIAWDDWGFVPRLYACVDPIVVEDNAGEIRGLINDHPGTTFYLHEIGLQFGIERGRNVVFSALVGGDRFSMMPGMLTDFGNVGATCFQILARLGYRRVGMIGIDARYVDLDASAPSDANGFIRIANDPNHFSPEYARSKRLRARPDLAGLLGKWPLVAAECRRVGMSVVNASTGSALACFPMTDFSSAADWLRAGEGEQTTRTLKAV